MGSRETWDNSPELRHGVKDLLINWAWHYSGGHENLGYPDHQPFSSPPARDRPKPPRYLGQDEADKVESVFRKASERFPEDEPRSLHSLARSLRPGAYRVYLRLEFILMAGSAEQSKAKAMRMSRRTYRRRIDDAMFWFWSEYKGG